MTLPWRRGLTLGLILATAAAGALGNGRFPTAQMVQLSTGARPARIVLRTTFGVLIGEDDGRRWSWMCESAFEYDRTATWDPPVALGSPGADGVPLLLGVPTGLRRTTDVCASTAVSEVGTDFTADVSATEDGRTVHWVGSFLDPRTNRMANRVRVSDDGGRSFQTVYEGAPGVLFQTMEAAPSNPRRVYLTAFADNPKRALLYRSDDGAATLLELPLDLQGGAEGWISAVDPTDPDVLYVRSFTLDPLREPGATLLLRSADGGAHFTELTRTVGVMRGFALSGDGQTVWVGSPEDGLLRSVGGGPFERVFGGAGAVPPLARGVALRVREPRGRRLQPGPLRRWRADDGAVGGLPHGRSADGLRRGDGGARGVRADVVDRAEQVRQPARRGRGDGRRDAARRRDGRRDAA